MVTQALQAMVFDSYFVLYVDDGRRVGCVGDGGECEGVGMFF